MLSSSWFQSARLSGKEVEELKRLMFKIKLYFDSETYEEAYKFFDDALFQNLDNQHAKLYRESGDIAKAMEHVKAGSERMNAIADSLSNTIQKLEDKTKVGNGI